MREIDGQHSKVPSTKSARSSQLCAARLSIIPRTVSVSTCTCICFTTGPCPAPNLTPRVSSHDSPRWLIPFKPDWKKSEDNLPRNTDYYESSRALGDLFRNVTLLDAPPIIPTVAGHAPLTDSISEALREHITNFLGTFYNLDNAVVDIEPLFRR